MVEIRDKGKETRKKIRDVQPKQNLRGLRRNLVRRLVVPGVGLLNSHSRVCDCVWLGIERFGRGAQMGFCASVIPGSRIRELQERQCCSCW